MTFDATRVYCLCPEEQLGPLLPTVRVAKECYTGKCSKEIRDKSHNPTGMVVLPLKPFCNAGPASRMTASESSENVLRGACP